MKKAQKSTHPWAMSRRTILITAPIIIALFVASIVYAVQHDDAYQLPLNHDGNYAAVSDAELPAVTATGALSEQTRSTKDNLVFLIEEEKLAHDVYSVLGDKWGTQVFSNITRSEAAHQSRILTLLQARSIADPRTGKVGTFTNVDVQKLYNDLIDKGMRSAKDAYEVGALIEQTDIADINKILKTETDKDVVDALNALKNGSYNHLRAFNRQLGV